MSDGEYQADAVTTRDWQGLVVAPELILDFLRTFSRFEFALKAAGFADGDEQRVAPAWDRFGRVIAAQVDALADAEFAASARYLLEKPPRKQVLKAGRLAWLDAPAAPGLSRAETVLLMVRRVRNNMFHGGKYLTDETADTARDQHLIESGRIVLLRCVGMVREVKDAYEL